MPLVQPFALIGGGGVLRQWNGTMEQCTRPPVEETLAQCNIFNNHISKVGLPRKYESKLSFKAYISVGWSNGSDSSLTSVSMPLELEAAEFN